jgi:hypothetical protein
MRSKGINSSELSRFALKSIPEEPAVAYVGNGCLERFTIGIEISAM